MKYDTKRYTLIWYYDIDRGLGSETFFIWHSSDLLILYEPDGSPLSVGLNYYRGAVWGSEHHKIMPGVGGGGVRKKGFFLFMANYGNERG